MSSSRPKVQHDAKDFPGIELQADAHDLEPGMGQDQVNMTSDQEGSMRCRLGFKVVSFDANG